MVPNNDYRIKYKYHKLYDNKKANLIFNKLLNQIEKDMDSEWNCFL